MRRDCDRYARYLNNFRNPVDYGDYHRSNANSQGYRNNGNNMRGGRSYGGVLVGSSGTNANWEPQEWNDCYKKTAKFNTDEAPRQNDSGSVIPKGMQGVTWPVITQMRTVPVLRVVRHGTGTITCKGERV